MGKTTLALARELSVPEWKLHQLIRLGKIPEPPRVPGGRRFHWPPALVEQVKTVLGRGAQETAEAATR